MRDTLTAFRFLAIPAILAGCVLALPMYALRDAEMDVQAGKIIIKQKSEEAELAVQWVEDKGLLGKSVKVKARRKR